MRKLVIGLMTALVLAVAAAPGMAQVPRTMSYQGMLTDNFGTPIPDGIYSLTVRLYDAAAAGALVYSENFPTVAVSKGGFNVILGTAAPLSLSFDRPLWLSLQVGADPELSPRVPLASSPYSMGLALPFDGRNDSSTTPTFVVRNASASGSALTTEGNITVNGPTGIPNVQLRQFSASGGQLSVRDEANNMTGRMEIDANGTGGYFAVYRSASAVGFSVDGNDGTDEPIVTVNGSVRSAKFDMSVSGDAAVALPSSCISSSEEFNEPGVAENYQNSAIQVGLGVTTIGSRSITCPDDGYIIAMASGHCEIGHVVNTDSRILYGVNDVNGVFASSIGVAGLPSTAPSGNSYRFPCPFVGVWPVTAGAHTFYLLAQRIGAANGIVWNDPTLTLLYVPTAYGTVTGNKAFASAFDPATGLETAAAPPTESAIEAEKAESAAFDQTRIQRELDLMKAQLEEIKARMASDPNLAPAADAAPQK